MRRLTRAVLLALALLHARRSSCRSSSPPKLTQRDEEKLEGMLEQAINDYDVLQIADSKKKLKDAIDIARNEGVSGQRSPNIYVMLGIVEYADTRDKAQTKEYFLSALREDRSAQIDPVYQSPTLVELMEEARVRLVRRPRRWRFTGRRWRGSTVSGFEHEPVTDGASRRAPRSGGDAVPGHAGVSDLCLLPALRRRRV